MKYFEAAGQISCGGRDFSVRHHFQLAIRPTYHASYTTIIKGFPRGKCCQGVKMTMMTTHLGLHTNALSYIHSLVILFGVVLN
jgi:hypothetical protein